VSLVRWEELPQHRRDEINAACIAFIGMSVEMMDAIVPRSTHETLFDTESFSDRINRELAEERASRRSWWAGFWRGFRGVFWS
jgi:hypothetical protein